MYMEVLPAQPFTNPSILSLRNSFLDHTKSLSCLYSELFHSSGQLNSVSPLLILNQSREVEDGIKVQLTKNIVYVACSCRLLADKTR